MASQSRKSDFMQEMVSAFWEVMHIELSVMGITYTLWDVFVCGLILSLIGMFIGRILLAPMNDR